MGEVCGVLSSGVLALGLLYGGDDAVGPKTREFVRRFAEQNGTVRCIDLIGFDISSAMGGDAIRTVMRLLWFFIRGGRKSVMGL